MWLYFASKQYLHKQFLPPRHANRSSQVFWLSYPRAARKRFNYIPLKWPLKVPWDTVMLSHKSVCLCTDDEVMKQLLRETPQGLIKFQMYSKKDEQRFSDRRLNRVKNKNSIPLGPWAHTIIEGMNHPPINA